MTARLAARPSSCFLASILILAHAGCDSGKQPPAPREREAAAEAQPEGPKQETPKAVEAAPLGPHESSVGFRQVVAGEFDSCGLDQAGALSCWGSMAKIIEGRPGPFTQIDTNGTFHCGLREDGSLECWGMDAAESSTLEDKYVELSVGAFGQLCVRSNNGKLICRNQEDMPTPTAKFTQISYGGSHACGLVRDGSILCWGGDSHGKLEAPDGKFKKVVAGSGHSCAIRADDTLVCWGRDLAGSTKPPPGTFVELAVGMAHACAINSAGSLECWGIPGRGDPPAGTFVQVDEGGEHACALRSDEKVVCWGANDRGQATPP